jgi:hypothetical protein
MKRIVKFGAGIAVAAALGSLATIVVMKAPPARATDM